MINSMKSLKILFKITGIYCIENILNKKKYIGKSDNIDSRINFHKKELNKNRHKNIHLQRAWNNDGCKNFIFYIIEICPEQNLNAKEKHWIKELKTFGYDGEFGYNLTDGGDGISQSSFERSPEIRKKMSENHSDVSGCKNPNFGKKHSEETLRMISETSKGRTHSEESKKRQSEIHKNISGETRKKMSDSHTGKKSNRSEEEKTRIAILFASRKNPNASSKYFGVQFKEKINKWTCGITISGKRIRIGTFRREIDAAIMYNQYVITHGLSHALNIFEEGD